MKYINISLVIIISLFFFSCKKNSTNTNLSSSLVKTYNENITSATLGNSITTYNLSYDANGRVVSLISSSAPGNKFVYQYISGNSFTMDLYNSNVLSIHEVFFLNSFSLVDSTIQYNDTNDTTTEKYYYNSAKQLIKFNSYTYSVSTGVTLDDETDYAYNSSGDLIQETDFNGVKTYDYSGDTINNLSMGQLYFWTDTKLPTKITYVSGGITETANHTYTFDSQKRLTSDKAVTNTGDTVIKTYTY